MRLHYKYGLAPILTRCTLCGGDGDELVLLGGSCNKVCQKVLGEDYRESSLQRLPHGQCKKCRDYLKSGAAAYIGSKGEVFMLTAECVARNKWPGAGKVSRLDDETTQAMIELTGQAASPSQGNIQ